MQYSNKYIFGFTALVCLVCSLMISVSSVGLRSRQERNKLLDRKKSVLQACWLMQPGEKLSAAQIEEKFEHIETKVIDLKTGAYADSADYDPEAKEAAPENVAQIQELPAQVELYQVMKDGKPETLVLPIYGKGLWSTLYGFLALDADTTTIRGLTYYEHGETPGLGGEVDNPKWKAAWKGRKAYDEQWKVQIGLVKGKAGPPDQDPHHVDGLSGATMTSRGVTNMMQFWLGDEGYGAFLKRFREGGSA